LFIIELKDIVIIHHTVKLIAGGQLSVTQNQHPATRFVLHPPRFLTFAALI